MGASPYPEHLVTGAQRALVYQALPAEQLALILVLSPVDLALGEALIEYRESNLFDNRIDDAPVGNRVAPLRMK
jgi:hypothetical protein